MFLCLSLLGFTIEPLQAPAPQNVGWGCGIHLNWHVLRYGCGCIWSCRCFNRRRSRRGTCRRGGLLVHRWHRRCRRTRHKVWIRGHHAAHIWNRTRCHPSHRHLMLNVNSAHLRLKVSSAHGHLGWHTSGRCLCRSRRVRNRELCLWLRHISRYGNLLRLCRKLLLQLVNICKHLRKLL